jgi:Cu-Zn family superoxide dismutase
MPAKVTHAVAVVHPLGDGKVKGKVTFTQKNGGVEIAAELSGLAPGEHGFHVHEFGDCSMADGTCAGGHFNPTGAPHGGPDDAKRHAGDFGNIKADDSGKATYKRLDKMVALNGKNSIIGRSVIVHAGRDDLKTQPSGDAGARVGCGVIGIADPKMQH